jgi:hypothetical protein
MTKRPDPAFHTLTTGAAYSQEAAIDKIGPPALQEVTMVVNLAWRLSRLAVMPRDRLRGWACRTRTQKCRRKLSL